MGGAVFGKISATSSIRSEKMTRLRDLGLEEEPLTEQRRPKPIPPEEPHSPEPTGPPKRQRPPKEETPQKTKKTK